MSLRVRGLSLSHRIVFDETTLLTWKVVLLEAIARDGSIKNGGQGVAENHKRYNDSAGC